MADISAKVVQALREKTGLPLMDCKRALVESAGNEAAAIESLRKKFADKMVSKADRVAANGRIGAYASGTRGALVEVRCETDFVAGNEVFKEFANGIARQVVETGITSAAELAASKASFAGDKSVQSMLEELFGKLGEKMEIARAVTLDGHCGTYVHFNGKIGALVSTDKPNTEFARQVCMHVASRQGDTYMQREQVPADMVEQERAKAQKDVAGKPANIADKIIEGKLSKWFSEFVLPEQPFALDDKKSVAQAGKDAGVTVTGFRRLEVGRVG